MSADSQEKVSNEYRAPGNKEEDYGYSFFPERYKTRSEKGSPDVKNFWDSVSGFLTPNNDKILCEQMVSHNIEKSPYIKMLIQAMNSLGCKFDPKRHVACEDCSEVAAGGYDPATNQIVICQKNGRNRNYCEGIMAHEMIHMYDLCRANIDFTNIRHVACTEVRAYNLTPCQFGSHLWQSPKTAYKFKKTHKDCVKFRAASSLMMSRTNVTMDEALSIVDSVFDKCYNDLEPLGYVPAYGNFSKAMRTLETMDAQDPYIHMNFTKIKDKVI